MVEEVRQLLRKERPTFFSEQRANREGKVGRMAETEST